MPGKNGKANGNRNSTNLVTKDAKKKATTKTSVASSFQKAYNKMLPVKVIRSTFNVAMNTATFEKTIVSQFIAAVAGGVQTNQRLGNSIYISAVKLKGVIQNNSVTKLRYLRVMIISEQNSGHLQPGFSDFYLDQSFASNTPDGTASDGIYPVNREQYITHYDHTYKILPEVQGGVTIDSNIKIGKVIYFPQADAASVNPTRGRIYLICNLMEGDNATVSTVTDVEIGCRLFFKDYRKMY